MRWTARPIGTGCRRILTLAGTTAFSRTGPGRPASAGSPWTRRRLTAPADDLLLRDPKGRDPQFCGVGRTALLLDHLAANTPEKLTIRLTHRLPGQNPTEFTAVPPAATGDGAWRTWRLEASQFRDASGKALPGWDHVEFFVLNGTSPANRPPVFKRLRWAK